MIPRAWTWSIALSAYKIRSAAFVTNSAIDGQGALLLYYKLTPPQRGTVVRGIIYAFSSFILADRTARSIIGYCYDNFVCLSVCDALNETHPTAKVYEQMNRKFPIGTLFYNFELTTYTNCSRCEQSACFGKRLQTHLFTANLGDICSICINVASPSVSYPSLVFGALEKCFNFNFTYPIPIKLKFTTSWSADVGAIRRIE